MNSNTMTTATAIKIIKRLNVHKLVNHFTIVYFYYRKVKLRYLLLFGRYFENFDRVGCAMIRIRCNKAFEKLAFTQSCRNVLMRSLYMGMDLISLQISISYNIYYGVVKVNSLTLEWVFAKQEPITSTEYASWWCIVLKMTRNNNDFNHDFTIMFAFAEQPRITTK